jgi:ectoine hydroxylase-related dioxygenase (phytanoyl-CoA dioxygenase family)
MTVQHEAEHPQRRPLADLPPRDWAAAAAGLDQDGVVCLKDALDAEALHLLEQAFARSMANPTESAVTFYPEEDATFFQDTGQNYLPLIRTTGIDTMVAALWHEPRLWYMGEQLFLKEGGHCRRTPWHQDTSYLRMRGTQMAACWITLDPLPRRHCLEFVRGSHRGTLYNGSAFAARDDTAPLYPDSPLPRLPDIEADRARFDIVAWDLEPGDVLVFHLGILHGGGGTEPGLRRRTASLRFLGPNVVYDAQVRDRRDTQAGNDAALAATYGQLRDGQPFHTAGLFQAV